MDVAGCDWIHVDVSLLVLSWLLPCAHNRPSPRCAFGNLSLLCMIFLFFYLNYLMQGAELNISFMCAYLVGLCFI